MRKSINEDRGKVVRCPIISVIWKVKKEEETQHRIWQNSTKRMWTKIKWSYSLKIRLFLGFGLNEWTIAREKDEYTHYEWFARRKKCESKSKLNEQVSSCWWLLSYFAHNPRFALWNVTTLIYSRWNNVTANNQPIIWILCECIGVVFHFCLECRLRSDSFLFEAGPKCTQNLIPVNRDDGRCDGIHPFRANTCSTRSRVNCIWVGFPNVLCECVHDIKCPRVSKP